MSESFCLWAPWVFSALAGILGWLLRWWYDDQKFREYESIIKTKEADVFHLNEAHNLLLKDKERRLANLQGEIELKNRSIRELNDRIEQTETSNKSLLSQIVEQKKKEVKPLAAFAAPAASITHSSEDVIHKDPPKSNVKMKRKKYKKKIRKFDRIIQELKSENKRLIDEASSGAQETIEIIKEIPVTITRTIIKRERVNRKKLKKLLLNIPVKKSKKIVKTKKKIGKARIIKSQS